jgi:cation diffusion facilitator CzcD-associated flavoprotein CzcO
VRLRAGFEAKSFISQVHTVGRTGESIDEVRDSSAFIAAARSLDRTTTLIYFSTLSRINTRAHAACVRAQLWAREGWASLLGTACAGFPNCFVMRGPHTFLGHNSVVLMIEAQAKYVASLVKQVRGGWAGVGVALAITGLCILT